MRWEASKNTFLLLVLLSQITHAFVTTRSTSTNPRRHLSLSWRNNPFSSSFTLRGSRLPFRHPRSLLLVSRGDNNDVPIAATTVIEYDDFLPRPHPSHNATDVVQLCMDQLIQGKSGAGLEVCFDFSSDRCRAALGGSLEKFTQYATNPVFGYLINCQSYQILRVGPMINGTVTRGAMQTVLMEAREAGAAATSVEKNEDDDEEDGDEDKHGGRKFLWTLQKERRPPRQGCWIIHEVLYVKNAFQQTL